MSHKPKISTRSKKISKKFLTEEPFETSELCSTGRLKGRKHHWRPAEDAKVLELMKQYGKSWSKIASCLKNRTGKQVRSRYLNYLRPGLNHGDFTIEEERFLLSLQTQYENKWTIIANHMPGRSEGQVKNHFRYLSKNIGFRKDIQNEEAQELENPLLKQTDMSEEDNSRSQSEAHEKIEFVEEKDDPYSLSPVKEEEFKHFEEEYYREYHKADDLMCMNRMYVKPSTKKVQRSLCLFPVENLTFEDLYKQDNKANKVLMNMLENYYGNVLKEMCAEFGFIDNDLKVKHENDI